MASPVYYSLSFCFFLSTDLFHCIVFLEIVHQLEKLLGDVKVRSFLMFLGDSSTVIFLP